MRREILGIALVFLVIFTSVSLLSYHPGDPSMNHVSQVGHIHNLFGYTGAYAADFLIVLFGLGSYWFPILLLIIIRDVFRKTGGAKILLTMMGGMLLALSTGTLLAFNKTNYYIAGRIISSGGIFGIPTSQFLERYFSAGGGKVVVVSIGIIAFILMTRFSFVALLKWLVTISRLILSRIKTLWIIYKERRIKAKARREAKRLHDYKKPGKKLKIKETLPKPIKEPPVREQETFSFMHRGKTQYQLPSLSFLEDPKARPKGSDHDSLVMLSRLLEKKMNDFGVSGKVVEVCPGPVITTFEYEPAPGVKINKVVSLADDLALSLRAISIRIVAPIPGKAAIGIEIPNSDRVVVKLKEILLDSAFQRSASKLTIVLGKDIAGHPVVADLARMPHLLIAGATGSGKSVALNAMICSIVYKATADEVKMIVIDPKRIELSIYDGIPHLITPVVIDPKKATNALHWAVQEMERRYVLMADIGVRNIDRYNYKIEKEEMVGKTKDTIPEAPPHDTPEDLPTPVYEKLPYIVVVIDELADLMMVASRDVEVAITRLSQMARAAGIHLLIATQRPSVDVLTGVIKANLPARISFQVSSKTDSRTILDANGAESLLGDGDMLFLAPATSKLQRIHGAHVSEAEIMRVVEFLKKQGKPSYDKNVLESGPEDRVQKEDGEYDEKYDEAVEIVTQTRQASISMLQRKLRVGYNRAARMIEMMEREGVVGPSDGVKPREVLVKGYE